MDDTYELFAASFDDFHNLTFGFAVLAGRIHQHLHEVAVQGVAEVAFANENVLLIALLQYPCRTAVLHLQPSGHVVAAGGLLVHVLAVQPVLPTTAF